VILPTAYSGKHVGVFGLARSGVAAARALEAAGANVWAWDDNAQRRDAVQHLAVDLMTAQLERLDALMLAPGVPLTHPEPHPLVIRAQKAGVPIISDFDLFEAARDTLPACKTVAITGTNGKSTTTALICHMLRQAGVPAVMGGNIGTGVTALEPLPNGGVYILEMSSFQIDLTQYFQPDIAVLLNLSTDHLDRHGTMENYAAAKQRLLHLNPQAAVILGVDDAYCRAMQPAVQGRVNTISGFSAPDSDFTVANGKLMVHRSEAGGLDVAGIPTLQGAHNGQNMAAAYAVGRLLGLDDDVILAGLRSFPGLAHRQELVPGRSGITYVNDSKATNMDAAKRGIASFRAVHWLAGGLYGGDTPPQPEDIAGSDIKAAYFYGQDKQVFQDAFGDSLPSEIYIDMQTAFEAADAAAEDGDVVLLSPASKAFDLYRDFEARGDAFKAMVAQAAMRARRGGER